LIVITAFINVPMLSRDGTFLGTNGLGLGFEAQAGRFMLASGQTRGTLRQVDGLAATATLAGSSSDVIQRPTEPLMPPSRAAAPP
jgi:hypothetical protein